MQKKLEEIEFTIFDTETTGLEPESGDRIVEIAGIRFKGEEEIATFATLVDPQRPISEAAFQVNRINPQMLKGAPVREEVLPQFLNFIQGSCLCSYNAFFDLGFLSQELKIIGKDLPLDLAVGDILTLTKRLLPGLERYALWFVAQHLGIETTQQHRALSDVKITRDIFRKLKALLVAKGITDFGNFLGLCGVKSSLAQDLYQQKLAQIQKALDLKVKLKIRYLSAAEAAISEREVIPKEIRQEKGRSYLISHCCLKNEERSFRIDGILHLEVV